MNKDNIQDLLTSFQFESDANLFTSYPNVDIQKSCSQAHCRHGACHEKMEEHTVRKTKYFGQVFEIKTYKS